jgi:hypothetical protein
VTTVPMTVEALSEAEQQHEIVLRPIWWAHPARLFLMCATVGPVFAWSASPETVNGVWGSPKYWGADESLLAAVYIACFTGGALIFARRGQVPEDRAGRLVLHPRQVRFMRSAVRVCLVLTVLAYSAWALKGVLNGVSVGDAWDVAQGERGAVGRLKRLAPPLAGVTTLTQLAPVVVLLQHLLRRAGLPVSRGPEFVVIALAVCRTLLYAERLAVIEVLLPYVALGALTAGARTDLSRTKARVWSALPLVAPLCLLLLFGVFEHSRSWSNYWQEKYKRGGYSQFVLDRTTAYYATSSNNAALLREGFDENVTLPYYTVKFFWNAPVLSQVISYRSLAGFSPGGAWSDHLQLNANPEFNNEGGLLVAEADYGIAGGAVYWFMIGCAAGAVYRRAAAGRPGAVVFFGVALVGLLEVSRIAYWGTGRFVPTAVAAVVIGHQLSVLASPTAPPMSAGLARLRSQRQ